MIGCESFHEFDTLDRSCNKMPFIQTQESDASYNRCSLISVDEGMLISNAKGKAYRAFKYVSILILPLAYGALQYVLKEAFAA